MCRNQVAVSAMILGLSACSVSHGEGSDPPSGAGAGAVLPSDPGAFRIELSGTDAGARPSRREPHDRSHPRCAASLFRCSSTGCHGCSQRSRDCTHPGTDR